MNTSPLSQYTRDIFLRLAAMDPNDSDAVEATIQKGIDDAVADARRWQPIENAPKDGSMILLAGNGWIDAGSWRVCLNGEKDEGWSCEWVKSWGYEEYAYCKPTHWMPLPSPPAN